MNLGKEQEPIRIDFAEKPIEKEYVTCYLDVLGTKQIINSKKAEEFFDMIYEAYSFAIEMESKLHIFGNLVFKVFSDNILIAHELDDDGDWYAAYDSVVKFLKHFLLRFLYQGVLFRGGITIGMLAINDVMVWGSGLVDVVNLEEKVAIYPRIVISNELAELMNSSQFDNRKSFDEVFSCLKDNDGSLFIDYINYDEMPTAEQSLRFSHEIMHEKELTETNQAVLQKIRWHLNYLEKARDIFNEYYGDFDRLEWEDNAKNEIQWS